MKELPLDPRLASVPTSSFLIVAVLGLAAVLGGFLLFPHYAVLSIVMVGVGLMFELAVMVGLAQRRILTGGPHRGELE